MAITPAMTGMSGMSSMASGGVLTISSVQNGNWSDSSTWTYGRVPTGGYRALITHVVTVDSSAEIGSSPPSQATWDGSGAATDPAIDLTVSGSGKLVIAEDQTLACRGSAYFNVGSSSNIQTGFQMDAGSSFIFDSSRASDDQSRYGFIQGLYNQFDINGTSPKRCSFNSASGYGRGAFTYDIDLGHCGSAAYCDFSRLGTASQEAFRASPSAAQYGDVCDITNCTWDDCGQIRLHLKGTSSTVRWNDTTLTNSLAATPFFARTLSPTTPAVQEIKRSVFGPNVLIDNDDWTIEGNFFEDWISTSAMTDGYTSFKDNMLRAQGLTTTTLFRGTIEDNYIIHDSTEVNWGDFTGQSETATDTIVQGNVWDTTSPTIIEASDIIAFDCDSTGEIVVQYNIMIPTPFGIAQGKFVSDFRTETGSRCLIEHNTIASSTHGDPEDNIETGIGVGERIFLGEDDDETDSLTIQSNIFWKPPALAANAGGFVLARHQSSTFQDFATAANVTHNWGWGLAAGSEEPALSVNGFHCADTDTAMFSAGAPSHVGEGDPGFLDETRNLATYDVESLSEAVAAAWATSTAYSAGDVRSNTDADFYNSTAINFHCTTDHTSGASTEPGVGADWRDYWELNGFEKIREDRTRIASLVSWVKAGFAPSNASLEDAGHDAVTVGAVEMQ